MTSHGTEEAASTAAFIGNLYPGNRPLSRSVPFRGKHLFQVLPKAPQAWLPGGSSSEPGTLCLHVQPDVSSSDIDIYVHPSPIKTRVAGEESEDNLRTMVKNGIVSVEQWPSHDDWTLRSETAGVERVCVEVGRKAAGGRAEEGGWQQQQEQEDDEGRFTDSTDSTGASGDGAQGAGWLVTVYGYEDKEPSQGNLYTISCTFEPVSVGGDQDFQSSGFRVPLVPSSALGGGGYASSLPSSSSSSSSTAFSLPQLPSWKLPELGQTATTVCEIAVNVLLFILEALCS